MIAGDAFDNSEWGRVQPRPIVINQLLFKADCKDSILTVPKGVKRFHSCLFANVYELMETAKSSWDYIRNGIEEMNDDSRCGKALDDFKLRVLNTKDGNDSL